MTMFRSPSSAIVQFTPPPLDYAHNELAGGRTGLGYRFFRFFAATAVAACLSAPAWADEGGFDIGITGGWTQFEGKNKVGNLSAEEKDSGGTFGVFARYTLPISKDGTFVGVHGAWQSEPASYSESAQIAGLAIPNLGDGTGPHNVTYRAETEWSADLLVRVGHDFGTFAPYIGGGMSIISISQKFTVTEPDQPETASITDDNNHFGWKIAIGTDMDLAENWVAFAQGEYASYGEESYFSDSFDTEGDAYALRVGVAYRF